MGRSLSAAQKERKRLITLYGHLYKPYSYSEMPGSFGCFYCGEPAWTIDHCPPVSWLESTRMHYMIRRKIGFYTVRCCSECNTALGSKGLFTLLERVSFLRKKLEDKYEKQVNLWAEDELLEMSPMFAKAIRGRSVLQKILLGRVQALQWREREEYLIAQDAA